MANLTQNDLKKGVLKGTNEADIINIDANVVGLMDKKITVKAGNGNDNIDITNHYGKFYAYAGMGSDTLSAGKGKNYLYGESGTNTFKFGTNDGDTVINAGKGKAIIDFSGVSSLRDEFFEEVTINDKFKRNGNDLIIKPVTGYDKTVTIKDFYKSSGEFIIKYQIWENSAWADKYYDLRDLRLTTNIADLKSANYTGGRLSEEIIGDARNNTIKGVGGGDAINAGDGNDKIYGGNNSPNMINGFDWLIGGNGNDTIYGNDGFNMLQGDAGNDVIYGGKDDDIIAGGDGNNKLYGKQGKNSYMFEGGNDTIYLEKDSETILLLNGYDVKNRIKQGNDVLINLEKTQLNGEKLEVIDSGSILLKNFFKVTDVVETITTYKNSTQAPLDEIDLFPSDEQYFQANGKGTIKGTAYNDDFTGSEKADKIYANGGYDFIDPWSGNDKIYLDNSRADVLFYTGDGKDTIYGGTSNLTFEDVSLDKLKYERVKNDLIIKYSEDDSVTLSEYFNNKKTDVKYIYNKNGIGSELSDILYGYASMPGYENEVKYEVGDGNVKFYAMPDIEENSINFKGEFDLSQIQKTKKGNDLILSNFGGKKGDKITIGDYFKNGINIIIKENNAFYFDLNDVMVETHGTIETSKFTSSIMNDLLVGTTNNDIIKTKDGHDTIEGSSGLDTVYAGSGNDFISYQGYFDFGKKLYGDDGNDTILASNDIDTIYGGKGNDYIQGEAGSDKIYGDADNDYISAGGDFDTVDGGAGSDTIYGGDGKDLLKGGAGNDYIYGDGGANTIYGGAGDDKLYVNSSELKQDGYELVHGDAGNDEIHVQIGSDSKVYGDSGNDRIAVYNGATHNEIYGGAGNDYISVEAQYTEVDGGAGNDVININAHNCEVEAGSGNDIINLAGTNTNVEGGAGNDTYNFNGGIADVEDSAGNDKYIVDSLLNPTNKYIIDDSKGKDTLVINYNKDDIELGKFNVQVNSKGKIYDLDDIDVMFKATGENGSVIIEEYFGSGCIERIETADGYYITKAQMQNVAQEVAAWLVENGFDDALECYKNGTDVQQTELSFIYDNINWQQ